ncbi:hypothetical protein SteCoe_32441 [Stentor coeruleus]|uniref:Lebercilin domain-containing protein n=1 Tax=Stentor coeruleus TaxID=5963 RepID=A0A1R2AZ20_9CILI|nr:hypothetical protein SteCoe_32441 [Stentor coeruleus]
MPIRSYFNPKNTKMTDKKFLESKQTAELLENQNKKLRNELKELTETLQSIKDRQRTSKVSQMTELRDEKDSYNKVKKYKQDIDRMKKELEGSLNMQSIVELENKTTYLTKRIEELKNEHKSLRKYEIMYKKLLDNAQSTNSYPEKISKLREEIRSNKDRYKELISKLKIDERAYKTQHERCVDLEERCRKLWEFIKAKRKADEEGKQKNSENPLDQMGEGDVDDIKERLKKAEGYKIEEEQKMKTRIKNLETQIREGHHHLEMLKIKLKEKDQECRLNLLKVSELKKASRFNRIRSSSQKKSSNTTPKNRNFSPKPEEIAQIEGEDDIKNTKKDSEKLRLFHQETIKAIERMNAHLNFDPDLYGKINEYDKSEMYEN